MINCANPPTNGTTMRAADVPTADYRTFTDLHACRTWIRARGAPIVVKASGLAAGKGAVVCTTVEEAEVAAEVAELLGCGRTTVYALIKSGELPGVRKASW